MEKISSYIKNEIFSRRLAQNGVLVVYDKDKLFRELCIEMRTASVAVIDTSESSIESRQDGLLLLKKLATSPSELSGLIVYVPCSKALSDEEKQLNPFSIYSTCGSTFPEGDGDDFLNICLKAKPNFATEIRKVFQGNHLPDFSIIDTIGGGASWPQLQALLKTDSAQNIIVSLLAPSDEQRTLLNKSTSWLNEAKSLLLTCLGMETKTRSDKLDFISDELWRFILFSEFVFDLPGKLPGSLEQVPKASVHSRPLIEGICDDLRNDRRTQSLYIDHAERVEQELNLADVCKEIDDLGERDTFPFEERSFLNKTILKFREGDTDFVRKILYRQNHSVWRGRGESQVQWSVIEAALKLIEVCIDLNLEFLNQSASIKKIIDHYVNSLREADRLQREFEQAIGDCHDSHLVMDNIIKQARDSYRKLMSRVHSSFVQHFCESGWPISDHIYSSEIFNKVIQPLIAESGRRVAFFQIDALRYELGVALEKQLQEDGIVELKIAYAQLPTVTNVGMASLLPDASQKLMLVRSEEKAIPTYEDVKLLDVSKRMAIYKQKYGDRFSEMTISDFNKKKKPLKD